MKKSYISPSTEVIVLHVEGVVASSLDFYTTGGGTEQLSNKREQDSNPIWGDEDKANGGLWN
ncbi:MAG: hypothetical protein SPK22_05380 [Alloprevotella sp.]|nr:hypothetical protein [Bacteroidales bacterium]MDY5769629.1 hypothetical protein [Alloprevotella sp.]